ncbi:MAG: ferrous iron transport protein B [Betaproteobacteria bacterium]|nr:ferrous iron transport protein B [Betaproteobacteria bacterium]
MPLHVALIGNPNCGKTALFNRLTGARHKVANYAGVTVERKEGHFTSAAGNPFVVIDLPGTYSLSAVTPDESITRQVLLGERGDAKAPDAVVLVLNATNLRLNLMLALEVIRLGQPTVVALNMMDAAKRLGMTIDVKCLSARLGVPVIETIAVQSGGVAALVTQLDLLKAGLSQRVHTTPQTKNLKTHEQLQAEVTDIMSAAVQSGSDANQASDRIDSVVLHPFIGYLLLGAVLFLIFQAVFSWAAPFMDAIETSVSAVAALVKAALPDGILRSLLVDGIIAGAGSVLVFLPQILILFFFILALEDSGYLPRAAFLLDRLMGSVGLSGRAFIPLLSSFACAVPGIMATRTIQNPRDRLATIMIAPLMTCSARLPVYALIISAFIPVRQVGWFNLQGLVLFALYVAGIVSAMAVAFVLKITLGKNSVQPLMLELPTYHWPHWGNLMIGLYERAKIFITRVGTIILTLMILLWFLSSFPGAPVGATGPAIQYSLAGKIGHALQVVFAPIGFNWQIAIALVPGLAAREVAVAALGTVYALSGSGDGLADALGPLLSAQWSLPTALSLLAWFVFAPQCVATLSIVKRETNSWRAPLAMVFYMFTLAYLAAWGVYRAALALLGA